MGQHLQAEGRRDTATEAGDPSPFKAFPARAVQLNTSDNNTVSRRHGTEFQTGRLHSVHNGPTVMGGRLVNPRVFNRDLFPKQATTQMHTASARAVVVGVHHRMHVALPVRLLPKLERCQMAGAVSLRHTAAPQTNPASFNLQNYGTHGMYNSSRHCSQYNAASNVVSKDATKKQIADYESDNGSISTSHPYSFITALRQ